jgi:hypothetical protein
MHRQPFEEPVMRIHNEYRRISHSKLPSIGCQFQGAIERLTGVAPRIGSFRHFNSTGSIGRMIPTTPPAPATEDTFASQRSPVV